MNVEKIRDLIAIVEKSAITSFELEEEGYRIRIGKEETGLRGIGSTQADFFKTGSLAAGRSAITGAGPDDSQADMNIDPTTTSARPSSGPDSDTVEIKSPMLGVFYSAPNPDRDPFVKVGDRIRKGDVLCIIEAMKLMNEIAAETDGEITGICIENGQIAEFGQTMFLMKPLS